MTKDKHICIKVARTFYTDDGCIIANLRLTGRRSAEGSLEGFLANSLNILGIKEIVGFKTRRNIGSGEIFSPEGKSLGFVKIWGKGFQKKKLKIHKI